LFLNVGLAVSLNLAIVVMSFTAPYDLITRIVSSVSPVAISAADKTLFFESIKGTYLVVAIINALAIVPSLLQFNRKSRAEKPEGTTPAVME